MFLLTDTEIDWIAYMQEVQGYEDGERNYFNLKGILLNVLLFILELILLQATPDH